MKGNGVVDVIVTIGFWALVIWGVSSLLHGGSGNDSYDSGSYSSGRYDDSFNEDEEEYIQDPENPYYDGSGHSAGYEWAEENDVDSCDGNSNSFIEGCEEYVDQRDQMEAAEAYAEEQDDYEQYDRY